MAQGRILVIRGGAIGDFILTLPVLSALRDSFPATKIHVLGYPNVTSLAVMSGLADEVRSIEARPLAGFFARGGELSPELCNYFSSFAVIISYLYDPDHIFHTNIARASKAQFIQGPHRPDEQQNVHATDVFLKPLERLAVFGSDAVPKLSVPAIQPSSPPCIAVHPGSGSEKKNWLEQKWADLLQMLVRETNHNILIIGGEAEGEKIQRLQRKVNSPRYQIAQSLPLTELAQRLSCCECFIGHDSGIMHLAAAVGLKGLALWGESNENIWRPRSERIKVLRGSGSLSDLSVKKVFDQVQTLIQA